MANWKLNFSGFRPSSKFQVMYCNHAAPNAAADIWYLNK